MDLSLLNSFIAVADEKSMSSAASHLFISQQALSKQMAKLEEELGTQLFVRSRPLSLTQDGRSFLRVAQQILHLKQQFDESCVNNRSSTHFVHLGIEHTIARAVLPKVLPHFMRCDPLAFVKVNEAPPELLQKAVTHDGVDVVIGSISSTPDSYESVELCKKEQLLVVPKPLMKALAGEAYEEKCRAFSQSADLRYFEKAPFIKIPRLSSGGRALNSYLKYYRISPHFVCELTNVENAFQLARGGLGVFIYPKIFWDMLQPETQKGYLESIDLFPLPYLPDLDSVCAYYHKERALHEGTLELLEEIKSFFAAYSQGRLEEWENS